MAGKHRAITDEQKEERRLAIIHAVAMLFQTKTYNTISMAEIAETASVAKGTLFLYFATKEELFLALASQAYNTLFAELNHHLKKSIQTGKACTPDNLLAILRTSFSSDVNLLRLMGIVSVILEQNIHYNTAFQFKSMLAHHAKSTGVLLEKAIPTWRSGEGIAFLLKLQALAIGFQHLSEPSPVIKEVIAIESLKLFDIRFEDYFFATLREILMGIETSH